MATHPILGDNGRVGGSGPPPVEGEGDAEDYPLIFPPRSIFPWLVNIDELDLTTPEEPPLHPVASSPVVVRSP